MISSILVVEDEENLRVPLVDSLELAGYSVVSASSVMETKAVLESHKVTLCILDIMLPDGNGYDLSVWLRNTHPDILIIMLTARTLDTDIESGFDSGADDYVLKPYRMKELLLRVRALLRRTGYVRLGDSVRINGFDVDWEARTVTNENKHVHLTKKQFDLLCYLYEHPNRVHSRDQLLNEVWGRDIIVDTRTVDNFISTLKTRLKLSGGEEYAIKTIRGVGYSFVREK